MEIVFSIPFHPLAKKKKAGLWLCCLRRILTFEPVDRFSRNLASTLCPLEATLNIAHLIAYSML
jgi:hypothetical protein